MFRCRVFLFTYKRNHLVQRAINSLLAQTFNNWVCEVHDDDPENSFVSQYILALNDSRFVIKHHPKNLGAVKNFNLAFGNHQEEFCSILEDDNWWEPDFLQTAIAYLGSHPKVKVVWSNMRLWQEHPGNKWVDTGKITWHYNSDEIFLWPQHRQAIGHLHSNGVMLYRSKGAIDHRVPETTLFNAVEAVRERSFKHPIALLAKPLGNFAITLSTNRSSDKNEWIGTQVMLLASYVIASPNPEKAFMESLNYHKVNRPSPLALFYLANLWLIKNKKLYSYLTFKDNLFLIKWALGNITSIGKIKKYVVRHQDVYSFLSDHTKQRFLEAQTA